MVTQRRVRSGISHRLVIAIIVVIAGAAFAVVFLWPEQGAERPPFVPQGSAAELRDDFAERTTLDWHPIRPSKDGVSLTLHPGELSIRTEPGTIWEKQPEYELAKNLYVIDNPATPDDDWQITTLLLEFEPLGQFHQAGLLIYQDDDNYIKFVISFHSRAKQKLGFNSERNGITNANRADFDLEQPNDWLRVEHQDGVYTASISYDGNAFQEIAQLTWDGEPRQIGLLAKQGANIFLPPIQARFDFFELKKLKTEDSSSAPSQTDDEGAG